MRYLSIPKQRVNLGIISINTLFLLATLITSVMSAAVRIGPDNDFLESKGGCSHTIYRQEWRTLTQDHQQQYIRAVKCSHTLTNQTSYPGAQTRLDDFQAVHIYSAEEVHHVGHFFPWHRQFLSLYERMLREECEFGGALPYWDWSLDADRGGTLLDSPIFDTEAGFGGDGVNGTYNMNFTAKEMDVNGIDPEMYHGCVMDGPFAYPGFTVHIGPGFLVGDHCLTRGVSKSIQSRLNSSVVDKALVQPTFDKFRVALEEGNGDGAEHGAGHFAVGGEFANLYSSPVEPIFFLHHANLDRIWWKWQTLDLNRRMIDISGNDTHGHNVSLSYPLPFGKFNISPTIAEVMDITNSPLCYDYL